MDISIVIGGLLTGIAVALVIIFVFHLRQLRKTKRLHEKAVAREAKAAAEAKARYEAETEQLHRAKAEQDRRRKEKELLDAIFEIKKKKNAQPRAVKQALSEDTPSIRPLPKNNHQTPTQSNISDGPNLLYNDYTPASIAYWSAMNASNNDSSSSSTDTSTSYSTDTSSSSSSDFGSSYDSGSSSSYDSGSSSSYDSGSSWGGGDSGGSGSF